MIRGLDDDEVDFLDMVDKNKLEAEKQQKLDELKELREFREKSASANNEKDLKEVNIWLTFSYLAIYLNHFLARYERV